MSTQILDIVHFQQQAWNLCGATPHLPFAPKDVGWQTYSAPTGNYKGCYCEYGVVGNQLLLTRATVVVGEAEWNKARKGNDPKLYGSSPELFYRKDELLGFIPIERVEKGVLVFNPDFHSPSPVGY